MITSLTVHGIATYVNSRQELADLAEFNFLYGPNGTGKTTISRVIAACAEHVDCSIVWKNGRELETLVYNRDFVQRVFNETNDLPGIFSLGEESAQLLQDIETARANHKRLEEDRTGLKRTLEGEDGAGGKQGDIAAAKETLRDACWLKKDNLGDSCREAFSGFLNNKARFVDEVIRQAGANNAILQTKKYLQERGGTIFGDPPQVIAQLQELVLSKLNLIDTGILSKRIIGKGDVDIAPLIEKLGNSDWVKQGRQYLTPSSDLCPFCQRKVPQTLEAQLNEYFDDAYARDIATVEALRIAYSEATDNFLSELDALLKNPPEQLDAAVLKAKRETLGAKCAANIAVIDRKLQEPSAVVSLENVGELLSEAAAIVEEANNAIARHNTLVRGLTQEKTTLKGECWRYLLDVELKAELGTYKNKTEAAEKAAKNLKSQITTKTSEIAVAQARLEELQRQTTSIEPTINAINGVLRSFGFTGFSLAQAASPQCYKLVREDGADAKHTLSEGERSFITFLYFYNLLQGSLEESGVTNDRVVVFDDPVSSLDSDVLFIVSTLIKRLQQDVLSEASPIKQLFVLTHNVYFHKEVTFDSHRHGIGPQRKSFWTIRKHLGKSEVTRHDQNPITTGYDLLWSELREQPRSTIATQNAMRRILEHYFKILGGRDPLDICEEFEGPDQLICRSLMSWINDGSHTASDDLYLAVDQETIENYARVFRLVFERTNHMAHYYMMMRTMPLPQHESDGDGTASDGLAAVSIGETSEESAG